MDAIYRALSSLGFARWALIILLIGIFIDINPGIKFNPIKAIFKYIGKSFNASMQNDLNDLRTEMTAKIQELQSEQVAQREALDKIILDQQNKEIQRLRWEIIDFNNGIINEVRHSRQQYRHVLDAFEKYNKDFDFILNYFEHSDFEWDKITNPKESKALNKFKSKLSKYKLDD